ncbi:MAG TPA: hypothetical protein PLP19_11085 [bacterium]|nr:hypothetical protein [bacterium]HPN44025.1 hypothetical protein [bacterium]
MYFSKDQIRYAENILNKRIETKQDFFNKEFKLEKANALTYVAGSKNEIDYKIIEFKNMIKYLVDYKYIRTIEHEEKPVENLLYQAQNGTFKPHDTLGNFLNKGEDKYKIIILDPIGLKKALKRNFISESEYLDLRNKKVSFWLTIVAIFVSILSLIFQLQFNMRTLNRIQKVQIQLPLEIKDTLKVITINPLPLNKNDSTIFILHDSLLPNLKPK